MNGKTKKRLTKFAKYLEVSPKVLIKEYKELNHKEKAVIYNQMKKHGIINNG